MNNYEKHPGIYKQNNPKRTNTEYKSRIVKQIFDTVDRDLNNGMVSIVFQFLLKNQSLFHHIPEEHYKFYSNQICNDKSVNTKISMLLDNAVYDIRKIYHIEDFINEQTHKLLSQQDIRSLKIKLNKGKIGKMDVLIPESLLLRMGISEVLLSNVKMIVFGNNAKWRKSEEFLNKLNYKLWIPTIGNDLFVFVGIYVCVRGKHYTKIWMIDFKTI